MAETRTRFRERYGLAVIYLALFLSGAAALVYQATWGRMLQRVFGVSDQAIATVLAAFFLGLGIGAALGGRWGTRFKRPALTYAVLEAGIGVFALISLFAIPRVHGIYAALGATTGGATVTVIRTTLALLLLLPPTILMGATLPVLIALLAPERKIWAMPATWLYATNTVGAMVGAGLTGLYLVPTLGARMSIVVAAVASLSGAALVAALWFERETEAVEAAADEADADEAEVGAEVAQASPDDEGQGAAPNRLVFAMVIAGVAGVASLASEVLWTRVLRMILVGTTQAFSAMLVNYLGGIALGSLLAAELIRRGYRSDVLLGASQVLLGVLTVIAMTVAPHLPRLIALIHGNGNAEPETLGVILLVSGLLLFPIALVLGTSIPLCWKIARSTQAQAPRHAGRILAANTIGGLCGSMIAGFGAVPALGLEGTLLMVMFLHLAIGGVVLATAVRPAITWRAAAVAVPIALGMLMLSRAPSLELAFMLHVRRDAEGIVRGPGPGWYEQLVYLEEGRNTTVTVVAKGERLTLFNDGRPESGFAGPPPGIAAQLIVLGSLANLYTEPRERALVVGLGAGHTTTMLLRAPWKEVHAVELEGAVVDAARFMHAQRNLPFPLDDERARLSIDDARAQLVLAGEGTLDAVVSQPSHPWLAGSSALYTQEFFQEVRRALRPTGTFTLWVNLFRIEERHIRRIMATLRSVFPHLSGFVINDTCVIFIASESPLPLDARVKQRYEELALGDLLRRFGVHGFSTFVSAREIDGPALAASPFEGAELIVDDRPALEFELARLPVGSVLSRTRLDAMLLEVPWISPESFRLLPRDDRKRVITTHVNRVATRPHAMARFEMSLPQLGLDAVETALAKGAIAAARGDVSTALTVLDSVEDGRAASLSDKLRLHLHRFEDLLERSMTREVPPTDPSSLMSAALARPEPHNLAHAIEVMKRTPVGQKSKALVVAMAMYDEGCDGVMGLAPHGIAATDDEYALFLAQRCAMNGEELSKASFFANQRTRVRMAAAYAAANHGAAHMKAGNVEAAILYFRRALAKDPAHGKVAADLAKLLAEAGDLESAEQVLHRAFYATRGLPIRVEVERAARVLKIELPK